MKIIDVITSRLLLLFPEINFTTLVLCLTHSPNTKCLIAGDGIKIKRTITNTKKSG